MNKWFGMGRIGKDPEIITTANNKKLCTFSMVTSERYQGKEVTQWHNITAWGKVAEIIHKNYKKGSVICLEGKINYSKWEHEGKTNYKTDIVVLAVNFIPGKRSESLNQNDNNDNFDYDSDTNVGEVF